jgi:hypothetical protein
VVGEVCDSVGFVVVVCAWAAKATETHRHIRPGSIGSRRIGFCAPTMSPP